MITIDVSKLNIKRKYPDYIVLFNPSKEKIEKTAELNQETFIFSFMTNDICNMEDMSTLIKSDYVMKPIYIGNYHENDIMAISSEIIRDILDRNF